MKPGKPIIPGCTALIVGSGLPHDGKLVQVLDYAWTGMKFKAREGPEGRIIVFAPGWVFSIQRVDGGPVYSPFHKGLTFDVQAISKQYLIRLDGDVEPESDETDTEKPIEDAIYADSVA